VGGWLIAVEFQGQAKEPSKQWKLGGSLGCCDFLLAKSLLISRRCRWNLLYIICLTVTGQAGPNRNMQMSLQEGDEAGLECESCMSTEGRTDEHHGAYACISSGAADTACPLALPGTSPDNQKGDGRPPGRETRGST
jgi:hypothetical protein